MTRQELQRILTEHSKWLDGNGGARANLQGADLRDADLPHADLQDADLRPVRSTINWLYMDATPGRCACCDGPLPPRVTSPWKICRSPLCRRMYHRLYRIDRSRREGRKPRKGVL